MSCFSLKHRVSLIYGHLSDGICSRYWLCTLYQFLFPGRMSAWKRKESNELVAEMGEEAWVHHSSSAFPKRGWELCRTKFKSWVSLAFRQDIDFAVLASSSQGGYLLSFFDPPFWPVIHVSHIVDIISIRVVPSKSHKWASLGNRKSHGIAYSCYHYPHFFLFWEEISITWAALANGPGNPGIFHLVAGESFPALFWLLSSGCSHFLFFQHCRCHPRISG